LSGKEKPLPRRARVDIVEETTTLREEIPIWQELKNVPDRIAALEVRLSALEQRLEKRPGEACPMCGENAVRLIKVGRVTGSPTVTIRWDLYGCKAEGCGFKEERPHRFPGA
jgi:hypothetical protein